METSEQMLKLINSKLSKEITEQKFGTGYFSGDRHLHNSFNQSKIKQLIIINYLHILYSKLLKKQDEIQLNIYQTEL